MKSLLFLLLLLIGCQDPSENESNHIIPGHDVYIVGSYGGSACYWLNGFRIDLPGGG